MERQISQWDFVSLRQSFKTSEGIVPENTKARVLELYGKKRCKVLFFSSRFYKDVVPQEILAFEHSHVEFTRRMLSLERPPVPMFHNIPNICYA